MHSRTIIMWFQRVFLELSLSRTFVRWLLDFLVNCGNTTLDNVCVHWKGSGNYKIKVLETGWSISTRFPGKLVTVRPFPEEIRKVEHIYGTDDINLKRANFTKYFCLQNIATKVDCLCDVVFILILCKQIQGIRAPRKDQFLAHLPLRSSGSANSNDGMRTPDKHSKISGNFKWHPPGIFIGNLLPYYRPPTPYPPQEGRLGKTTTPPPPRYTQHGNTVSARSVRILLECVFLLLTFVIIVIFATKC